MLRAKLNDVLKLVEAELELQNAIEKAQLPEKIMQVTLKVLIDKRGMSKVAFVYLLKEAKPSDLRVLADLLGAEVWVLKFQERVTATNVETGEVIPFLKEELDAFVELVL